MKPGLEAGVNAPGPWGEEASLLLHPCHLEEAWALGVECSDWTGLPGPPSWPLAAEVPREHLLV